jgi:hypothetical protein
MVSASSLSGKGKRTAVRVPLEGHPPCHFTDLLQRRTCRAPRLQARGPQDGMIRGDRGCAAWDTDVTAWPTAETQEILT